MGDLEHEAFFESENVKLVVSFGPDGFTVVRSRV